MKIYHVFINSTHSDLTMGARYEKPSITIFTSITVRNNLRFWSCSIDFGKSLSYLYPHFSLLRNICFKCCQMNWTNVTCQATICYHCIHYVENLILMYCNKIKIKEVVWSILIIRYWILLLRNRPILICQMKFYIFYQHL